MCGIAGIVPPQGTRAESYAAALTRMTGAIAHRGPDAHGEWAEDGACLGHRRLSIIDLSDAGRQPMADESGRYLLVFNGELYNYLELRDELKTRGYRFHTETDSEVLLAAYREWGAQALDRFNGMWAFAIWDRVKQELFLARDRAGKKPLYVARDAQGALFFASEVKAIRAAGIAVRMHAQSAFDFITQGTYGHLGAASFFEGVEQLPAGHWLRVTRGGTPEVRRWWDLPLVPERDRLPYDDRLRARFRELLTDAVRLRLRSDVPVGATLSGGLDSSTLVLLVDQVTGGAPLHLFTSLYPGTSHDETPYFDSVVERLRAPIVHRVAPRDDEWKETLLRVLEHQEEPFGDTSILAHFSLMRAAREQGVPVVLSGQGGDELLLGYPSMVTAYLGSLAARGRVAEAAREVVRWSAMAGIPMAVTARNALGAALPIPMRDRVRQRFVARMSDAVTPELRARASLRRFADERGRSSLDSYLAQVFKRFAIPHLTHYDDRNAMAFAVEGRMPFLDHRLVELLFSTRYDALYKDGVTKRILRESFADVLPPRVRDRRDKIGFYTPLARWLREHLPWVQDVMAPERVRELGVLAPAHYAARLSALRDGDTSAALAVWRGFIFHLWADRFELPPLGSEPAIRQPILEAAA